METANRRHPALPEVVVVMLRTAGMSGCPPHLAGFDNGRNELAIKTALTTTPLACGMGISRQVSLEQANIVSFAGSLSDLAGHPLGFLDEGRSSPTLSGLIRDAFSRLAAARWVYSKASRSPSGMLARQRAIQPCVRVRSTIALGSVCMRFSQTASASS